MIPNDIKEAKTTDDFKSPAKGDGGYGRTSTNHLTGINIDKYFSYLYLKLLFEFFN